MMMTGRWLRCESSSSLSKAQLSHCLVFSRNRSGLRAVISAALITKRVHFLPLRPYVFALVRVCYNMLTYFTAYAEKDNML